MTQPELPALDTVDAALFDLDGTLVDSEPMHRAAWQSFFASRGWEVSQETYTAHFVGRRGSDAFRGIDGPWRDDDPEELLAEVLTHLATGSTQPGAVPGAVELLRRVHDAGVPIAVVTSAVPPWAYDALEHLGIAGIVSVVVNGEDVAVGKPDPAGYLQACARLDVQPDHVIAFEDSASGIAAAAAAGIAHVVGVLTTSTADALRAAGAHHVIEDLGAFTR